MNILSSSSVDVRAGNPYPWALAVHLRLQGAEVRPLDGAGASRWSADAAIVHWPEAGLRAERWTSALSIVGKTLAKLLVLRLRRIPVVWTIHNVAAHGNRHPRLARAFWKALPWLLSGHIALTESGRDMAIARLPRLAKLPSCVIAHPHYRDLYPDPPDQVAARRRLGLPLGIPLIGAVGRIAPYKGIGEFLRQYIDCPLEAGLVVAGYPESAELGDFLRTLGARDPRVHLRLESLSDDQLVEYTAAVDLVVLPYRQILNSGSALLALSLARPVLAPAMGALPELRDAEGESWVHLYAPPEPGCHEVDAALRSACRRAGRPQLAGREWVDAAAATKAFLEGLAA